MRGRQAGAGQAEQEESQNITEGTSQIAHINGSEDCSSAVVPDLVEEVDAEDKEKKNLPAFNGIGNAASPHQPEELEILHLHEILIHDERVQLYLVKNDM